MPPNHDSMRESTQFAQLLNVFRDPSANWSIDVAKELSDYAASLGIIDFEPGDGISDATDGVKSVDFAEAALLVQGSTSIYSRKVEHLYSLVYTAVSMINEARGKDKTSGNGMTEPQEDDPDADELLESGDIDFLTLDDRFPQVDPSTINLAPSSPNGQRGRESTRLVPIPALLMPPSALAGADATANASLRMASAYTHASGALILPGGPVLDSNLDVLDLPAASAKESHRLGNDTNAEELQFGHSDDDDNDDAGNAYDFAAFDDLHDAANTLGSPDQDPEASNNPTAASVALKNAAVRHGAVRTASARTPNPVPRKNPFQQLDPHDSMGIAPRPPRKGRTYKRPKVPSQMNGDFAGHQTVGSEMDTLADCVLGPLPRRRSTNRYVSFSALAASYGEVSRRRTAAKRQRAMLQGQSTMRSIAEEYAETENAEQADGAFNQMAWPEPDEGDGEDDDAPGGDDVFDNFNSPNMNDTVGELSRPSVGLQDGLSPGSVNLNSEEVERLAATYEDACRRYLANSAKLWEQHATDANLIARVAAWTARVQPLLREEETRREFDIQEYGQSLLLNFEHQAKDCNKDTVETKMSCLFGAPHRFEVCRMFLATLQLANNYAIEIVEGGQGEFVRNPTLRLLTLSDGTGETQTQTQLELGSLSPKQSSGPELKLRENELTPPAKAGEKRNRRVGTTPSSARRQPLRARLVL